MEDTLFINNEKHLHIGVVEVFTGDDEYFETDCVEIESENDTLHVKQILTRRNRPSCYRLRGEPGIRAHIMDESGRRYILTIAHHKGSVHINAKEVGHVADV